MNYYPGWYPPPPQYPPYGQPPNNNTIYVPVELGRGGKIPRERDLAKQLKKMFEVQKLLKDGGEKKDEKKDDKKKPFPMELLILGVLASPIVGYPTLLFYQKLFSLWGSALGVR